MDDASAIILVMGICCISIMGTIIICEILHQDNYTYADEYANVTGKNTYIETTMMTTSDGKTISSIPISETHYEIFTTKGTVEVPSEDYYKINSGDVVILTKNLNTSVYSYHCMVDGNNISNAD